METITKTLVGSIDLGISVIGLSTILLGGMWTFSLWDRKAVKCYKCDLMNHTSRNMEDNGTEDNLKIGDPVQKVSKKKKNLSMWPRCCCDISMKKITMLCTLPGKKKSA